MSKPQTQRNDHDAPSPDVALNATTPNALPLNRPALLGTFGNSEKPGALIRLPAGKVLKVSRGQQTEIGKVLAVAESEVILLQNGRPLRLKMPS